MTRNRFPPGWDEKKTRRVLTYYENQSDQAATAEDERAFARKRRTVMEVPSELVPVIRGMLELLPATESSPRATIKARKPRAHKPVEAP